MGRLTLLEILKTEERVLNYKIKTAMKTKILTGLFALIVASAFCQSKTSKFNLNLESRANYEILPKEGFQIGKCYKVQVDNNFTRGLVVFQINHERTTQYLTHTYHFTNTRFNENELELVKYLKYQYIKDLALGVFPNSENTLSQSSKNNNITMLKVENFKGFNKEFRVGKIVFFNKNTDGSKILWLIRGAIKYSQYNVIKGDFSWDNGLYRFFTQNIASKNM